MTPSEVLEMIRQTRTELLRGADFLQEAELAAERAEDAAQLAFDKVLMQVDHIVTLLSNLLAFIDPESRERMEQET